MCIHYNICTHTHTHDSSCRIHVRRNQNRILIAHAAFACMHISIYVYIYRVINISCYTNNGDYMRFRYYFQDFYKTKFLDNPVYIIICLCV